MRIVTREEFHKLPAGTIYNEVWYDADQPFGRLAIKGESKPVLESGNRDFSYVNLSVPQFDGILDAWNLDNLVEDMVREAREAVVSHTPVTVDDQDVPAPNKGFLPFYAIWDRNDVTGLMTRLQQAITDGYPLSTI